MTSNVNNQGIAHLAFKAGGQPFCKSRRAHIVIAHTDRAAWGRICWRCSAKADGMQARRQAAYSAITERMNAANSKE